MFDSPPAEAAALARWIAAKFPEVRTIDAAGLARRLGDPGGDAVVLVDVRTPAEQAVSTLAGAIRVADGAGAVAALAGVDRDAVVVVYCAAGVRSARAARALMGAGHRDVASLVGGIFAWANGGHPLVTGDTPTPCAHPFDERWGAMLDRRLHRYAPGGEG